MSDASFIDYLHELLAGLGAIQAKRMFGGHGIYHDAVMIGLVADDRLYLKVDAQTAPRFAAAGCTPFVYSGGGRSVQMSYWSAPEDALEAPAQMLPWARLAYAAALRNATAKTAKTPRTGKPRAR